MPQELQGKKKKKTTRKTKQKGEKEDRELEYNALWL